MINGLEGIPGSGKSYEAVTFHVLHALKAGRLVITNLPLQKLKFAAIDESYFGLIDLRTKSSKVLGSWDAARVDDKGNGQAYKFYQDNNPLSVDRLEGENTDNGVFSKNRHEFTGRGVVQTAQAFQL